MTINIFLLSISSKFKKLQLRLYRKLNYFKNRFKIYRNIRELRKVYSLFERGKISNDNYKEARMKIIAKVMYPEFIN